MEHKTAFPLCINQNSKPSNFCPGCGHSITLKMLGQVIDELKIADKTVFLIDIGCSLLAWNFFNLDTTQTHHGRTIPVALGFKMARPDAIVIAYIGDGGGYAIGLQHAMNAALKNYPITTILVNNTNYGMTGGQMAPSTFAGETTMTTIFGKDDAVHGKTVHGPEILKNCASANAYFARGSVGKPLILKQYLKKALENQLHGGGFSFVESLSFCPTNWKTNAGQTLEFMKKMETEFKCGEL